jgi:hypothetical protein
LLKPLAAVLDQYRTVVVNARSLGDTSDTIGIHLLMGNGKSFAAKMEISKDWHERKIPISSFHSSAALVLPDFYPRFLPKLWNASQAELHETPDLRMLDRIQITIDPSDAKQHDDAREMSFEVSSISLIP